VARHTPQPFLRFNLTHVRRNDVKHTRQYTQLLLWQLSGPLAPSSEATQGPRGIHWVWRGMGKLTNGSSATSLSPRSLSFLERSFVFFSLWQTTGTSAPLARTHSRSLDRFMKSLFCWLSRSSLQNWSRGGTLNDVPGKFNEEWSIVEF
jgi:hypothetical protein